MTQSATQPASQPAPPAPATAAVPAGQPAAAHVDTPALLNRWQLIGMAVVLVFAAVSAALQLTGWQSDGRAADDTEQLVRVQEIQSSLLRADALATNAFLVGGLEDPAQREEYDAAIEAALALVADAAEAQSADEAALAALNVEIADYATAVAQARDNNRQGFPIGAEYLSGASTALRADALPILDNLVAANTERADGSMDGQHPVWLFLLGAVALAGLFWLNAQLARHFRRRFNKGLLLAGAIVLGLTLLTTVTAWAQDSGNDALADDELAVAISQADARTAANDAKASESLRLIKRGSGEQFEDSWTAAAAVVEASLTSRTEGQWESYAAVHQQIVELDRGGQWSRARDLATTTAADGSTAPLDRFDGLAKELVADNGAEVTDQLRGGRVLSLLLALATLGLGVVAAFAVARGIGERRREFA